MQLYIDTSALVKLVSAEAESGALRGYLAEAGEDTKFTAAIARTELARAAARLPNVDIAGQAKLVLARLHFVQITTALLDVAAGLRPPELRTLDAIHLAAALTAPELRAVVTYDSRLSEAATTAGLAAIGPA